MAKGDDVSKELEKQEKEIMRIQQRLDMWDERLDNIDSMVTAVAERVMSQLVSITVTCPHCGKDMEIGLIGSQKPRR